MVALQAEVREVVRDIVTPLYRPPPPHDLDMISRQIDVITDTSERGSDIIMAVYYRVAAMRTSLLGALHSRDLLFPNRNPLIRFKDRPGDAQVVVSETWEQARDRARKRFGRIRHTKARPLWADNHPILTRSRCSL